jgi:DGQHR domain-containing protein
LPVVLGSAPARDLFRVSFADVLDESAQVGYQRPCDRQHADDFRTYIESAGATTIPLTLNLRGEPGPAWRLEPEDFREGQLAELRIRTPLVGEDRAVARVDCQHRLEMMGESSVPLAFQCFLGLTPAEEMRVFNVINSKVKGLNPSLIDYHESVLIDVAHEAVDLYVAKRLNDDPSSVWHGRLKLGGAATQGTMRRMSLRGMRHSVALFLQHALVSDIPPQDVYRVVAAYWSAAVRTWPHVWGQPRKHLLTKGIGVQGLSLLAADIANFALREDENLTEATFQRQFQLLQGFDWSNTGPLRGLGGRSGARELHLRLARQLFPPRRLAVAQ